MKIVNYAYVKPTIVNTENKTVTIDDSYSCQKHLMSDYNFKNYAELINSITPKGRTAVLYIGGAAEHHSLTRLYPEAISPKGVMPVQSQMGYVAGRIAKLYKAEYLSINANACASSMYALHEAEILLNSGYDDVIIYGEERVSEVELLLFRKMGIDLFCGEGLAIVHLQKGNQITDTMWRFYAEKTAFTVSVDGYKSVMPKEQYDFVKTHGTGTPNNTTAEDTAIAELYGDTKLVKYKPVIGHTQGISTILELCLLLDDDKINGIGLMLASGLGNFYGSCKIII